jgi:hypothetical protein
MNVYHVDININVQNDVIFLHQITMIHVVFLWKKQLQHVAIKYSFSVHEHRLLVIVNNQFWNVFHVIMLSMFHAVLFHPRQN